MNKSIMFVILAGFVALLIGCHCGGHAPYINLREEDRQIITIEREVGEDGRFADIIFPSGAIIRCTQDGTMQKGTKVSVTERKTAGNTGSAGETPAYIYDITAKLFSGDALNTAFSVNTLEKPLSVTLPNNSNTGLCYLGTRTSETDPWRYSLATEGGQANARFIRLSSSTIKTPTFELYRLGIEFALFVFNKSGNEAEVDSVEISAEKVAKKDGKYADKLIVKMVVEGENLSYLSSENLVARITYRTNTPKGADLDFIYNKIDRDDKAVSGKQEHSFEINNLMQGMIVGNKMDISFVLYIYDISLEDFPTTFLIEFYSASFNEKILPFCYTQVFNFETQEQEPPSPPTPTETYTITIDLNGGILDKTTIEYTAETESFDLPTPTKEGYDFLGWTGSETTVPLTPMTIKQGTTGDKTFTANWSLEDYSITYNNVAGCTFETANPTTYNIESDEITLSKPTKANDIFTGWTYEGQTTPQLDVKINKGSTGDKVFNANWENFAVVSLKSAATDFPVDGQIQLELDKDIAWQDSFKNCITITPIAPTTPTITINSISYSNKILTLTLSENLKYSSQYQIAVAGIENVCDNSMTFMTVALVVTPQISSKASDISQVNGVDRHILQPTFTIDYGKKILNQTVAKSNIKLNDAALPNSCTLVFDEDGKIATLTFTADLDVFTDYTLSLNEFADDDNATINAQTLSFKTVPPEGITGEGTLSSPYLIYTQAHLNKLREDAYLHTGKYFKQMDNIVMTGNWTPIGSNSNKFYGFYDGNNLKITGLTIQANNNYVGLFSSIGSTNKSKIENLKLENVNINGAEHVGALAGYINKADVTNVHVMGEVNIEGSGQIVGGLTGECCKTQITRCSVDSPNGLVNVGNSGSSVGGLIGLAYNGVENNSISESYASIIVQGNSNVGGLVGYMYKYSIENSYSNSSLIVIGNNPTSIGGLIGEMYDSCSFNNCYAKVAYGSGSVSYGNCLVGYIQNNPFVNSKNNFAWRDELTGLNNTKILYKYQDAISPEDGKDSDRNNYFSNGYPSSDLTGANWDAWDPNVWDNLTPGNYPKLNWQSGN
ncbi:MAG: InlB B-repeat-containing protein [Candidatus Riflebacteria bacterium]|nr:InlB B-repeat-containing protein [Candidatus Riflebacteria bacterium]